jgi:hypothetical protein
MFGRGKFHAGILIEPTPGHKFDPTDVERLSQFRNEIWPTVEKANEFAPQHSRVFKEVSPSAGVESIPLMPFSDDHRRK